MAVIPTEAAAPLGAAAKWRDDVYGEGAGGSSYILQLTRAAGMASAARGPLQRAAPGEYVSLGRDYKRLK